MESLNLNNLVNSLPTSSLVNAEKDVADKFRGRHVLLSDKNDPLTPRRSGRAQHHHTLQVVPEDVEACIQCWLRSGLSRYAPYDTTRSLCWGVE